MEGFLKPLALLQQKQPRQWNTGMQAKWNVSKLFWGRGDLSSHHSRDCWGTKGQWWTQTLLQAQHSNRQRTGSQTCWQHIRSVQRWQYDNSKATPKAPSIMVSPLLAAPKTHSTWRDNESYNVLERDTYHNLVTNKVMQNAKQIRNGSLSMDTNHLKPL